MIRNLGSFSFLAVAFVPAASLSAQGCLSWLRQVTPPSQANQVMATNINGNGVLMVDNGGGTWTFDGRAWVVNPVFASPPGRSHAAMAWDAVRDRVVLFGGNNATNVVLADTWEWDGVSWQQMNPALVPAARYTHAMAYDWGLGRIVMFGGWTGGANAPDTWEWDGVNWTRFTNAPPARHGLAMASASNTGDVLIFGGSFSGPPINEAWRRTGATWSRINSPVPPNPPPPPADRDHAMALDIANNTVVMIGGSSAAGTSWRWDPNTRVWTAISPGPFISGGARLAYDVTRFMCVALDTRPGFRNFELTGTGWVENDVDPPARQFAAAGHDRVANELVLHGGLGGPQFDDTWTWNGTWSWSAGTVALALRHHSIDWDPASSRLLMFGGWDGTTWVNATRLWDRVLRQWSVASPAASPSPRHSHATASVDTGSNPGIYLFGGSSSTGIVNDLWRWNGTTWSSLVVAAAPPARHSARLAPETGGGSLILFGGLNSADLGDTWRLTLGAGAPAWNQMFPTTPPAPRSQQGMAFDVARNRIILTGGTANNVALSDSHEWDCARSQWQPLANSPFQRGRHVMTRLGNGSLLVFGGLAENGAIDETTWISQPFAAAQFQSIGSGCRPTAGAPPTLTNPALPLLDCPFQVRMTGLPLATPTSPVFAAMLWSTGLLPNPVTLCGSCQSYLANPSSVSVVPVVGSATFQLRIPNVPALVGVTLFLQGGAIQVGTTATCLPGAGLSMTNAARFVIGSW